MKEIMKRKDVFWDVNNHGNGLVLGILFLNLVLGIGLVFSLQMKQVTLFKKIDPIEEVLKIKAIQQIEEEFYDGSCDDFSIEEEGILVEVNFYGSECHAYFYTEKPFEMIFTYDDIFLCIATVDYFFEE